MTSTNGPPEEDALSSLRDAGGKENRRVAEQTLTEMDPAETLLIVEQHVTQDGLQLRVTGEVDAATEPILRRPLMEAVVAPEAHSVTVDLRRVAFLDSSGLALLMEAHRALARTSRALTVVVRPGSPPDLVLRKFRFDRVLHVAS